MEGSNDVPVFMRQEQGRNSPKDKSNEVTKTPPQINYSGEIESGFRAEAAFNFSVVSIRLGFIRKVFGIFSIQLLVTIGFVALTFSNKVKHVMKANVGYFAGVTLSISLLIFVVLMFKRKLTRRTPLNFVILGISTVTLGLGVASLSTLSEFDHVLYVGGMLLTTCITLTLYTIQPKYNLKWYGSLLITFGTVGLSFLIVYFGFPPEELSVLTISAIVTLCLGIYLTTFIHCVLAGACCKVDPEDYVFAAVSAYFTVVGVFLLALAIVGLVVKGGSGDVGNCNCSGGGGSGSTTFCYWPMFCGGVGNRERRSCEDEESRVQ